MGLIIVILIQVAEQGSHCWHHPDFDTDISIESQIHYFPNEKVPPSSNMPHHHLSTLPLKVDRVENRLNLS